jgi:hypothetical protein
LLKFNVVVFALQPTEIKSPVVQFSWDSLKHYNRENEKISFSTHAQKKQQRMEIHTPTLAEATTLSGEQKKLKLKSVIKNPLCCHQKTSK